MVARSEVAGREPLERLKPLALEGVNEKDLASGRKKRIRSLDLNDKEGRVGRLVSVRKRTIWSARFRVFQALILILT